jgi:hypothetical protein
MAGLVALGNHGVSHEVKGDRWGLRRAITLGDAPSSAQVVLGPIHANRISRTARHGWNRASLRRLSGVFHHPRSHEGRHGRILKENDTEEEEDITDAELASSDVSQAPPCTVQEKTSPETPYHIFTNNEKWRLVYIVSLAGLFSPLSSNIYFPALGAIAEVGEKKGPRLLSSDRPC